MTLVSPCVLYASFRPSEILSPPLLHFCRINLKCCRLFSYDMKMCTWFSIFVSAIFDGVMALADSNLVLATPATSLIELI